MATLVIAVIFLGILIVGHEFGHFIMAKLFRLRVDEFAFGFPPRIFRKKIGETTYSVNAVPFGGFVRIYGESYEDKSDSPEDEKRSFRNLPPYKKALIITAGALMNFIIGWIAIAAVFMIGVAPSVFVGQVVSGSPADAAGIAAGDQILGFGSTAELVAFINSNKGEEIFMEVLRSGENIKVSVTPRIDSPDGEGPIGVSLIEGGIGKRGFFAGIWEGLKTSLKITALIFSSLYHLIAGLLTGNWEAASVVTGPVGVFSFLGTASGLGLAYLLQILGLISLNLTVINIIPFPALDGGRLLFVIYEKLSGRMINYRLEAITHAVGFAVLIFLMIMVTIKDIINLI